MYHRNDETMTKAYAAKAEMDRCCTAAPEQTVGEFLDVRIFEAERDASTLRDLKASLPGSFLTSGASRITALAGR